MKLLDLVLKEYLSIVDVLEESETIHNDRIIIDREQFKKLLEKYKYMNIKDKIKIYKDLNLIVHDKNNYTLPVKNEDKKTVRMVVINYQTYNTIKKLYETDIN